MWESLVESSWQVITQHPTEPSQWRTHFFRIPSHHWELRTILIILPWNLPPFCFHPLRFLSIMTYSVLTPGTKSLLVCSTLSQGKHYTYNDLFKICLSCLLYRVGIFGLFLTIPQQLSQCLAYGWCVASVCWVNEWMNEIHFFYLTAFQNLKDNC